MNPLLKKAKDIYREGCVSIILNTHRTAPDNKKDPLVLKNLVKETEERLAETSDKKLVQSVMERIRKVAGDIDHSHNLESLVLFANPDFADYTRMPVQVKNRVVIDNTFATRDLIRAMHQESSYYVLVLSRQKARLIEAYNDKVVQELKAGFPMDNNHLYATNKTKLTTNKGQDNLIEEFFNRVDKKVLQTIKDKPLPIVLATEKRNYDHYLKIADKKDLIIGYINRNRDDETAHHIVRDAWEEVHTLINMKNRARIEELHQATGQNHVVSDYNEIWDAIQQGRGKTLFVKKGFHQPALINNNKITPVNTKEKGRPGVVDDIIDEMIEQNLAFGGDTVFLDSKDIDGFQNIALTTRY